MAIIRQDEILEKALPGDPSAVPRYNLRTPDGSLIGENVALELVNAVAQIGTPINAAALNEILAASGVTAGNSTAYTLSQEKYSLFSGAEVKLCLHVDSGDAPTLDVNGTGARAIIDSTGEPLRSGMKAGTWVRAIYSETKNAYVASVAVTERWITNIESPSSQLQIPLPDGFKRYHIIAYFSPVPVASTNAYREIYLGSDVILNWMFGGVSKEKIVQKTVSANTAAGTGVMVEKDYGGGIDLLVIVKGSTTRITGTVFGSSGVAGVGVYANSNALGVLKIQFTNSASIAAGATIILEGVRE